MTTPNGLEPLEAGSADQGPAKMDPTFRNGSVTAIGIVCAFSLSFLGNWSLSPGIWTRLNLFSAAVLCFGILFQIAALAGMLDHGSLVISRYNKIIAVFLVGLIFSVSGVALAIFGELIGLR